MYITSQGVTTHNIGCTIGLDIRLLSGFISGFYPVSYPAVEFGQNMAVFSDFQVLLSLTIVHIWLIFRYILQIFF